MNASSGTRTFGVDSIAPLVTIINPGNVTYTTLPILFNFTLNEAGSCRYSLNNGVTNYTMTANVSLTGFNATNSSIANGGYTVKAYCNDSAGNKNYSETKMFSVNADIIAPLISIVYPINNTNYSNAGLNVNYTVSDNTGGSCWYSNDTYNGNKTLTNCANITDVDMGRRAA